jgi:hypothetical protein
MSRPAIESFKRHLRNCSFRIIHQGIAFDADGRLVDGQKRLTAIVETGIGAWINTSYGVDRDAILVMDQPQRRNPADQIRMFDPTLDPRNADIAIARAMLQGTGPYADAYEELPGSSELHPFLREHWAAIRFARRHRAPRVAPAAVRGAVARAYYHVEHLTLDRFMIVLASGFQDSTREHAAVALRNYLLGAKGKWLHRHVEGRRKLFGLTRAAIVAFCDGAQFKVTRPTTDDEEADPWPIPARAPG